MLVAQVSGLFILQIISLWAGLPAFGGRNAAIRG